MRRDAAAGLLVLLLVSPAPAQVDATSYVTSLYVTLLCRQPEPAGLQGWVTAVTTGTLTPDQVRAGFLASPEYLRRGGVPCGAPPPPPQTDAISIPVSPTGGLIGGTLVNSRGAFPCDGGTRTFDAVNVTGGSLYLRVVREWHGLTLNGQADFLSQVFRLSDGGLISLFQQDRYANPGGVTHADLAFPVPVVIAPGDGVRLHVFCNPSSPGIQGEVDVQGWATGTP